MYLLKKDNKRLSTCDNDILLKARFIIEQIVSYVLNVDAIKAKEIFGIFKKKRHPRKSRDKNSKT